MIVIYKQEISLATNASDGGRHVKFAEIYHTLKIIIITISFILPVMLIIFTTYSLPNDV